ncbi:hypothetical protein Tco_1359526 [Tanacetum coccineum]
MASESASTTTGAGSTSALTIPESESESGGKRRWVQMEQIFNYKSDYHREQFAEIGDSKEGYNFTTLTRADNACVPEH